MAYGAFARVYDKLTADVRYDKRADYICSLLNSNGISGGILLDLACGTGSLAARFCEKGFEVIGVDNSPDMLALAGNKLYDGGYEALLLCQDMAELDLYGTVDAVVCSLDSLNHIIDEDKLLKVFQRVALFMNPGGVFVFDVNTPYKHREILGNNTFVYDAEDVFCVWRNEYCKNDVVNIYLDIFICEGNVYRRYTEEFCERAYGDAYIKFCLEKSGLELVASYGEMTLESAREKDERVYYVVKKLECL